MDVELPIDSIHTPGVEENQCHENVNRALLCKPEAELETANSDLIQFIDKQNAESEGTDKPDEQAKRDQPQIGPPIGQAILKMH